MTLSTTPFGKTGKTVTRIGFDSAKMWKASEAARPSDSPSGAH